MIKYVLVLVLIILLVGCDITAPRGSGVNSSDELYRSTWALPPGAKVIKDYGNEWIIFEIDNMQFLYGRTTWSSAAFSED